MPHYELYDGDEPLWCHLGTHEYADGQCRYCQFRPYPLVTAGPVNGYAVFSLE